MENESNSKNEEQHSYLDEIIPIEATDATRLLADIATKYERKFVEWRLASADPKTSASRTSTIEGARKFTELRTAMDIYSGILSATGNGELVIKIAQRLNTELPKPILPPPLS